MKKYLKENIKNLPFILVAFIMFYSITTLATNYLFNSNEVSYDNTETGLHADEVQGAIDEVFQHATDYTDINNRLTNIENNFLNKTYPIGSIYISATDSTASAVAARFGGTWEAYATGRTLIGMGSNGTNNYTTIGATGGASSHIITTDNMPSHTHTYTDYYANSPTGSTTINFSNGYAKVDFGKNGWVYQSYAALGSWSSNYRIRYTVTTAGADATDNHNNGTALGGSQSHTHTLSNTSTTRTSDASGKGSNNISALSTIDPYITVYMWKRTA